MKNQQADGHREEGGFLQWCIPAGDDGIKADCILIAAMAGSEMQTVSLHVQEKLGQ